MALATSWILVVKAPCTRTLRRYGSKLVSFVPSESIHRRANTMVRAAIFLAVSAAITRLSWRSLRDWRSHGFYRFFALELLSALLLLNISMWFRDPLSARQLVSWFLGACSTGLAIEGFRLLRLIGRPTPTAPPAPIFLLRTQPHWSRWALIGLSGTLCTPRCWRWCGALT